MAGIVEATDGRTWGASSWVFYWAVDALAARARHPGLAAHLREVSEHHLGGLHLGDVEADQRDELIALVRALPDVARGTLPQSAGREDAIQLIRELAELTEPR